METKTTTTPPPPPTPTTDDDREADVWVIDPVDFAKAMSVVVGEEVDKAIRRRQGKVD